MLLSAFQCLQDSQGVNSGFLWRWHPPGAIEATLDFDEDQNENQWKKPHGIGLDEVGLMSETESSRFGAALAPHCSDETGTAVTAEGRMSSQGCGPGRRECLWRWANLTGTQAMLGATVGPALNEADRRWQQGLSQEASVLPG